MNLVWFDEKIISTAASSTSLERRVGPAILPSRATCTTSATSTSLQKLPRSEIPTSRWCSLEWSNLLSRRDFSQSLSFTVTLPPFQVVCGRGNKPPPFSQWARNYQTSCNTFIFGKNYLFILFICFFCFLLQFHEIFMIICC